MNKQQQNSDWLIEKLREKLHDYESAVPDGLWASVESALPSAPFPKGKPWWKSIWVYSSTATIAAAVAIGVWLNDTENMPEKNTLTTDNSLAIVAVDSTHFSPSAPENPALAVPQDNTNENSHHRTTAHSEVSNKGVPEPSLAQVAAVSDTHFDNPTNHSIVEENNEAVTRENTAENSHLKANPELAKKASEFSVLEVNREMLTFYLLPVEDKGLEYEWILSDGTTSSSKDMLHAFANPGIYTAQFRVRLSSGDWLPALTKTIEAVPPVTWRLPNVFTPNGDGVNDALDVMEVVTGAQAVESLIIMDARGKEVRSIQGSVWDGRDQSGAWCPAGPYHFVVRVLDFGGKTHQRNGVIQLVP